MIDNDTGRALRQYPCVVGSDWHAFLTNGHDASGPQQAPDVLGCTGTTPAYSVPTGEARLTFTIPTRYFTCTNLSDDSNSPKCLTPGDRLPPLPAGRHRIVGLSPFIGVPQPAPLGAVIVR